MFLVEGIAQLHPALVTAPAIWSLGNKVFFLAVPFWVILYCLQSLEVGRHRSPTPWCGFVPQEYFGLVPSVCIRTLDHLTLNHFQASFFVCLVSLFLHWCVLSVPFLASAAKTLQIEWVFILNDPFNPDSSMTERLQAACPLPKCLKNLSFERDFCKCSSSGEYDKEFEHSSLFLKQYKYALVYSL
ncbi:hypothetical protein V1504DRAFT_267980 [Lipomyces starkeyi]